MTLLKTENQYLEKYQWRRLFLATSIITIALYIVAMVFSLCGSNYFILNYQNEQMDKIENFLTSYGIMPLLNWVFTTIEFFIVCSFVNKRITRVWYILAFYGIAMFVSAVFPQVPVIFYQIYPFVFHIAIPVIEQFISTKHFNIKIYLRSFLRLLIAVIVVYTLQVMIYVIKNGDWSLENHIQPLATAFIFAIEYDIALSVLLFTIALYIDREKGDSLWATYHNLGLSSQTSKTQSQKSNTVKTLTKTQRNKLRWLYARFYLTQLGAFLLLMVLPFLLGKVFEFLVMYLSFAVSRYILGFKYSLHYKNEVLCITVGVFVFGILSLTVPFFYVLVIIAVTLGVGLAVLLHLSYKYKGFYLFAKISRPDRFAELYVLMDGDLDRHHIAVICNHKGVPKEDIPIICDFGDGNKKSYIANKYHYSEKTIERKINEAIELLKVK